MTLNEARNPEHRLQVWLNIKSRASFNRKYEPLKLALMYVDLCKEIEFKTDRQTLVRGHIYNHIC